MFRIPTCLSWAVQPELVFTATIRVSNLPADYTDGDRWLNATTTDTSILAALTKVTLDPYEDFALAAVDVSKIDWTTCKPQRHRTVWLTESVNGVFKIWGTLLPPPSSPHLTAHIPMLLHRFSHVASSVDCCHLFQYLLPENPFNILFGLQHLSPTSF